MNKIFLFSILFFLAIFSLKAQVNKDKLKPKKIGFLYNYANEKNFMFDDKDYSYNTNTYKIQAFYNLGNWKNFNFELILQPQYQKINHQLDNSFFVLPTEENFEEKIKEFTTPKTINLYGFELGFVFKKQLFTNVSVLATIGLGLANIDTRTERLAKGFTFLENGSLGFSYQFYKQTTLYLGSNIGHVSNLDTKKPNNGYTFLGFEVGLQYALN
ncbi:acyloxyacyl hydrolase [Polaribacter sp.]|uniref:acyloxyacyl hydrolase n=1 Tax=Polaribacter sp. TaxID=1920175 RepID=UPI003F6AD46D